MTLVATPRGAGGSGLELLHSMITVPFAAGMALNTVPFEPAAATVSGALRVGFPTRETVLCVRLKRSLGDRAVVVDGRVGSQRQRPVVFAPYSPAGTLLPIYRPPTSGDDGGVGSFTVNARVYLVDGADAHRPHPPTGPVSGRLDAVAAAGWLEGAVVEGRIARLLLLTTLEKQRMIRVSRQVAASRHLELARFDALDRMGESVGVPRRADVVESDEAYRSRLAIHSPWRLGSPGGWAAALNGPGDPGEPNRGLPARVGVQDRFRIIEATNPLSISTKLVRVGPDGDALLDRFHQQLVASHLFDIRATTVEHVAPSQQARLNRVRNLLRSMPVDGPRQECRRLSRLAAITLANAVAIAEGAGRTLRLERAYDPDGGPRHELGLGVQIRRPSTADLRAFAAVLPDAVAKGGEIGALAASLDPRPPSDDPLGRWLFEGCGMRTVHDVGGNSLYLSPIPMRGQWIDGPDRLVPGQRAAYETRYRPSDSAGGIHVRAAAADEAAPDEFATSGLGGPPSRLSPSQFDTALDQLIATGPTTPPARLQQAIDLGIVSAEADTLAEYIRRVINLDQVVAYPVDAAEIDTWGGPVAVGNRLTAWAEALRNAGFFTVRAVWDQAGTRLLILASISQLPGSVNLVGTRPPGTFYWYGTELPVATEDLPRPVEIVQSRGGRATVESIRPGLALLVAIGYERVGLADPFEVRVELERADAVLDADQYGYLMNLLESIYPIGIEVNTFDVRRSHVDADGDGATEFLTSSASRTYHRDRHRRPFSDRNRSVT